MLKYTITGDTLLVQESDRAIIEKRFSSFEKFAVSEGDNEIIVTISKTTAHERENTFRVEVRFKLHKNDFFATGEAGDVISAVDDAKAELMREVTSGKDKRHTLFHRGARKIKSLIQGVYKSKK